jgi:hypothetical protein
MAASNLKSVSSFGLVVFFLFALHAEAQQETTFVSGTGSDSNPCTRALPCLTLAGALLQTNAGGKVYVMDALDSSTPFAPVITKSVSIIGAGARTSISGQLVVQTNPGAQVLLKGLDINAVGGLAGVYVAYGGASVVIDDCTIVNGQNGIFFQPGATTSGNNLVVRNSIIAYNTAGSSSGMNAGILILASATVPSVVVIENTNVNNNNFGIRAFDNSVVTVRNSVVTENVNAGFAPSKR